MSTIRHVSVFGAGAWGTALALALAPRFQVTLWGRNPVLMAECSAQRENRRYLPGVVLPDQLHLSADLAGAVATAELLLLVTPVAGLRETLCALRAQRASLPPLLWACKGLEVGSTLLPHQIFAQELAADVVCGVLSGPSFAREVAQGLPTALTLASTHDDFAQDMAQQLHAPRLRVYASQDVIGVEVGGAVKNVMAIAAGVADGLSFGHNARAALITRGLAEATRLAMALGGSAQTMMGLAGLGDLVLTCTGDLSRNRRVGLMLAQGMPLSEVLTTLGHVAEGVPAAREVHILAQQLGVEMPITRAVCEMLFDGLSPLAAVEALLERGPARED